MKLIVIVQVSDPFLFIINWFELLYNLQVKLFCHICNCYYVKHVSYRIFRHVCDLHTEFHMLGISGMLVIVIKYIFVSKYIFLVTTILFLILHNKLETENG
jgi:hypothetical protein